MLRCDDSPDESIMSGRTGASGRTGGGNESYFDEEYEDGEYADEDHFDQFDPGRRPDPFDLPSPYERGRAQRAANQNRLPKRRGSSAGRQSAGVGGSAGGLRRHNSSVGGGRDGFGMTQDRDRNYGSLRKSKDHHRSNPQLSNNLEPHRFNRDLLSPPGSERGDYRENRNRDFDGYKRDRGINRDRGLDITREFDRRMPKRSGSAMDLRGLDRGLDTGSRGRLDFADRALDRDRRNLRVDDRANQRKRDDSHSRSMKNLSRISQSIRDIRGTSEEDLELINA